MRKINWVFVLMLILCCSVAANEKRTIYDFEYGIFTHGADNYEEGDKSVSSGGDLEKNHYH